VHNAGRSHGRATGAGVAGTSPAGKLADEINPAVVTAMEELGLDLKGVLLLTDRSGSALRTSHPRLESV
jgi:hypothetical protein